MRRQHFEVLNPVCPRCLAESGTEFPLGIARTDRESDGAIEEGALLCPNDICRTEFPIIDGIPILVPNLGEFLRDGLEALAGRTDLSPATESLLGDCVGPGTVLDTTRQHLSIYGTGHYGDLDPEGGADAEGPQSLAACLGRGLELLGEKPAGPVLDLGCSVGRTAFELAAVTEGPVLGVDLNLSMLRVAQGVLREGRVRYPRRRVGVVYDRREFAVNLPGADRVDYWACDAVALPFAAGSFGFATALNLIDVVGSPLGLLGSIGRALRPGGGAILASPYDWSPAATPYEAWIGGRSQRSPTAGSSEPTLRSLLTPDGHPQAMPGLSIIGEDEDVPWRVRLHARSTVEYRTHVLAIARA